MRSLGGPSYAAGAESLFIAGAMYCEPGVSGPGWAWTDADHLELNGYTGEAIGADEDLVVKLTGQNTVVETSAPDVDISRCGMEVWGDLTLRGTGSLVATGSQCGIYASGTLAVDGCKVDARADGAGIADARVVGVIADGLAVRGGGACCRRGRGLRGGRVRLWCVSAGRGCRRWRGRAAYRRCILAGCVGRQRRRRLLGRVACIRALCGACGWGLWRRRRGGCRRVRGGACNDRARRCHDAGGGDRWARRAGQWSVRPWR